MTDDEAEYRLDDSREDSAEHRMIQVRHP